MLMDDTRIEHILGYYMGKNTPQRQTFIIDNLKIEKDLDAEDAIAPELEEELAEA